MSRPDDYDDELTLAAILLILAQEHPDQAYIYALLAEQAAKDAQFAITKMSGDIAAAVEAAAVKADAVYHATLAAEGEAAARLAFEAEFQVRLQGVLDMLAARVELIASMEIIGAWNDANYSGMFEDETGHWQFHGEMDAVECKFCKRLEARIFANSDAEAGKLLPAIHFNCFPADELVRGLFDGGLKTLYSGEIIKATTLRGNRITSTANHPIATTRGLVAAEQIKEGDYLLCHPRGDEGFDVARSSKAMVGIFPARGFSVRSNDVNPHEQNTPSAIEQVYESLAMMGELLRPAPARADDLYGDGRFFEGDVEAVTIDRALLNRTKPSVAKRFRDLLFTPVDLGLTRESRLRSAGESLITSLLAGKRASGTIGITGQNLGVGFDVLPLDRFGSALPAGGNPTLDEPVSDRPSIYVERVREALLRFPSEVAADQVVLVERESVVGFPVFDLSSQHGWILASNIYASNCRCWATAVTRKVAASEVSDGSRYSYTVAEGFATDKRGALGFSRAA